MESDTPRQWSLRWRTAEEGWAPEAVGIFVLHSCVAEKGSERRRAGDLDHKQLKDEVLLKFPCLSDAQIQRYSTMSVECISVTYALKLISPFSMKNKEVLTFVSNVNTALKYINPNLEDRLCQFVLTRISVEPNTAIAHKNL